MVVALEECIGLEIKYVVGKSSLGPGKDVFDYKYQYNFVFWGLFTVSIVFITLTISRSHVIYTVLIKYVLQWVNTFLDTLWLQCFIKFAFYANSTAILLNIQNLYKWEKVCSKVRFLFSNGKKVYFFSLLTCRRIEVLKKKVSVLHLQVNNNLIHSKKVLLKPASVIIRWNCWEAEDLGRDCADTTSCMVCTCTVNDQFPSKAQWLSAIF